MKNLKQQYKYKRKGYKYFGLYIGIPLWSIKNPNNVKY